MITCITKFNLKNKVWYDLTRSKLVYRRYKLFVNRGSSRNTKEIAFKSLFILSIY